MSSIDFGHTVRHLVRSPGYAAAAVVTLAFATRIALGAPRHAVVRGVLARAATHVAAGLAIGLAGAAASGRAMRGLLFGVAPDDATTYAAVLLMVLTVVAVAAYLPARRAGQAEPQALLRQ